MMMTTVSSPQNASTMILSARRGGIGSPFGKFAPARDQQDQRHQAEPEQKARDDAGEEQIGDRDRAAGRERIDHRVVRRRDQQRLHRARAGHADGEQPRIAVLHHLRDHHRADRGGVGDRRARDAAEEGGRQDVDQRQAAADEADEHLGEVDQALGHAALGHDAAGQHEERDREQREVVGAVRDLEHHRLERDVDPQRREQGGEPERVGDRHAERAEDARSRRSGSAGPCAIRAGRSIRVLTGDEASSAGSWNSRPVHSRSMTKSSVIAPPIGTGR